jgi:hypothetical protein
MLQYLQWVRLLSFTWCLLFGETSGDIYGRPKEIPGIIYKNKGANSYSLYLIKTEMLI